MLYSIRRALAGGAVGGIVGGAFLALTLMIYGWLTAGRAFWDAPLALFAWLVGMGHFGQPANHIGPIVGGAGAYLAYGLILGVAFALVTLVLRPALIGVVITGIAFAVGVWAILRYEVLTLNDPESVLFTRSRIAPPWVWWLGSGILGLTVGVVLAGSLRLTRRVREPLEQREAEQLRPAA
jgi:hypothetical protein